jgi:hypothetical protein
MNPDLPLTPLEIYCLSSHAVDGASIGAIAAWRGTGHATVSRTVRRARGKLARHGRALAVGEGTGAELRRRPLPADY